MCSAHTIPPPKAVVSDAYNLNSFFIFRSSAMTSPGSVFPVALSTSGSYKLSANQLTRTAHSHANLHRAS